MIWEMAFIEMGKIYPKFCVDVSANRVKILTIKP